VCVFDLVGGQQASKLDVYGSQPVGKTVAAGSCLDPTPNLLAQRHQRHHPSD